MNSEKSTTETQAPEKKEEKKMYTVLIKRKRHRVVAKRYRISFANPFEAFEWGERQAKEFGPDYFAELGPTEK